MPSSKISIILIIILLIGFLSDWSGNAIVIVTAVTEVNFTTDSIDWGTGSVTSGKAIATLDSDAGTVTNGSWSANSGELVLENIGDENVTIDIASDKDADALVGGSAGLNEFQWKMANITGEEGACVNITDTSWTDVNTTSPGTKICDLLYVDDTKDEFKIDFRIVIPSDTTKAGQQTATITATATLT